MALATCPGDPDLLAFHLGDLPIAVVDPIADHVETCSSCEGRLRALDSQSHKLLVALRLRLDGRNDDGTASAVTPAPGRSIDPLAIKPRPEEARLLLGPPLDGDEIGWLAHYRVLRVLGQGGMGIVFEAEDTHLHRRVALKAMRPHLGFQATERQRFLREARAMAQVCDDHIVTVYQVGQDRDVPYLAMELLPGQSLQEWLASGRPVSLSQGVRIGREVAEGLAAAHEHGLIHRDIKPANLWLVNKENLASAERLSFLRVKILDFGLARAAGSGQLTSTGMVLGTPAYMAPEQAKGESLDARADLFSLGCVLYRLCTGDMPFHGSTATALLIATATETPRPVRELNGSIPAALADCIDRLLAKPVAQRPVSARAVAEELAGIERSLTDIRAPEVIPFAVPVREPRLIPARPEPAPSALLRIDATSPTARMPVSPAFGARRSRRALLSGLAALMVLGGLTVAGIMTLGRDNRSSPGSLRADGATQSGAAPTIPQQRDDDDAWFKSVAALPIKERVERVKTWLAARNSGFNPAALTYKVDGDDLVDLTIHKTTAIDLSALQVFPTLRSLNLIHMPCTVDLTMLKGLHLRSLDLRGTGVSDLSPLSEMKLEYLEVAGTKVADLKPIQNMKTLKTLYFDDTAVRDLTPVAGLELVSLNCSNTGVDNLTPLRDMKSLRQLTCGHTNIRSLGPLEGLQLSWLTCDNTPIDDLTPLKGMPLNILDIAGTRVRNISVVKNMPLEKFYCAGTSVRSLEPLAGSSIISLNCSGTVVDDLTPLLDMPLAVLDCSDTGVASLAPLSGMPLAELYCQNCKIKDLTPIGGLAKLRELRCDFDAQRDTALLRSVKTLEKINQLTVTAFWKTEAPK